MDRHSVHVLDLPLEVTTCILDFLTHSDLKDARLVCRKWYLASFVARNAKKECLLVQSNVDVGSLLTSERSFQNIQVKRKSKFWSMEDFWHRFGPKVQFLTLSSCSIPEDKIFKALNACPRLKNIKLENCVSVQRSRPTVLSDFKMTHLKSITLTDLQLFDSLLCDCIVERAPNLEVVIVECWLEIGKEFFVPTSCHILPVASYMEKMPHIQFDLRLHFIDANYLEQRLFKKIVRGSNVHVTSLFTNEKFALRHLNPRGNLKELNIWSWNIDSMHFAEICDSHPGLEKLTVERCDKIMSSIQNLSLLQNLTLLDLSFKEKSAKFSDEQIRVSLCSTVNTTLKSLHITGCGQSEDIIVELARTHPALTELMFHRSPNVTDWSIQAIFRYQVLLESLKLSYCENISDRGLCGKLLPDDPSQPFRINPTGHSISRLKGLKRLSFQRCPKITGQIFGGELASLEICRTELINCKKITVSAVKDLILNNPMLEVLVLRKVLNKEDWDSLVSLMISTLWRLRAVEIDTLSEDQKQLLKLHIKKRKRCFYLYDTDDYGEESETSGDLSEGDFCEESDCELSGRRESRDENESQDTVHEVPENVKVSLEIPKRRENVKSQPKPMKRGENAEEQGNEMLCQEKREGNRTNGGDVKVQENTVVSQEYLAENHENHKDSGEDTIKKHGSIEVQENSVDSEYEHSADQEHMKNNEEKPLKKGEDEKDSCENTDEEDEDDDSSGSDDFDIYLDCVSGILHSSHVVDIVEEFLGSERDSDELDDDSCSSLLSDGIVIWSDSSDDSLDDSSDCSLD